MKAKKINKVNIQFVVPLQRRSYWLEHRREELATFLIRSLAIVTYDLVKPGRPSFSSSSIAQHSGGKFVLLTAPRALSQTNTIHGGAFHEKLHHLDHHLSSSKNNNRGYISEKEALLVRNQPTFFLLTVRSTIGVFHCQHLQQKPSSKETPWEKSNLQACLCRERVTLEHRF